VIVSAIKAFFTPPGVRTEEGARVSMIVTTVSAAVLLGLAVLLTYRIAMGAWQNFAELAALAATVVGAMALVHRKHERAAAGLLTWSLLAFVEYMVWKHDGLHDTALIAFPGVLVLGSIVLRKKNFTILTLFTLGSVCVLGALEVTGIVVSRHSRETGLGDVLDMLVMTGVTGVAVRILADTYQKNIARLLHKERELRRQTELLTRSEDKVRESEAYYRTLVETSPEAIVIIDRSGRVTFASGQVSEMLGAPQGKSLVGRSVLDWLDPGERPRALRDIARVVERMEKYAGPPSRLVRDDGNPLWVEVTGAPLFDAAGTVTGILLVCHDITARMAAEGALRESEERFARLAEASFEGIAVTEQGRVVDVNPQLARMFGYEPLEMIGKLASAFVAPESRELVGRRMNSGDDEPYEHFALRKDGSRFPVEVRAKCVGTGTQRVRLTAIRDVSERRRMEEDLRVIRRAVEQSPASIVITSTTGAIEYANPKFLDLTGYTEGEVLGENPRILKSGVTPAAEYERLWNAITHGGVWRGEFCNRKKNGDLYWEDASISGVTNETGGVTHFVAVKVDITERKQAELAFAKSEQRYRDLIEQLPDGVYRSTHAGRFIEVNPAFVRILGYESKEELMAVDIPSQLYFDPVDREARIETDGNEEMAIFCLRRKDGSAVWVEDHGRLERNPDGEILYHEGILRDVTDRLRAEDERKRLEEQLFQAQKMESIGTMAAGLAHDFNNILNVIIGNCQLLGGIAGVPDSGKRRINNITKASDRGAQLVKKLMTFARKTEIVERPLAVNELIREAIDLVRTTMPRDIEIRLSLGEDVPEIVADGGQLQQVLMNFCVNARDAMPEGGTLTIATSSVAGVEVRSAFPAASAERYARISVADTGCGMDEATRNRIFDPFFTTKKPDRGTGLGLAVVNGIVAKHNGFVDVLSAPGKGSEFVVLLPVPR